MCHDVDPLILIVRLQPQLTHKSSAVRLQSCNIFIHSKIGFIFIFISFEPFYTINGYTIWCPPSVLNISNGNLKLHIPEIDVNVNIHLITVVLQC